MGGVTFKYRITDNDTLPHASDPGMPPRLLGGDLVRERRLPGLHVAPRWVRGLLSLPA